MKLESWQEDEARQLNERLAKELDGLVDCQKRQRANLEAVIARVWAEQGMIKEGKIQERQQLSDSIAKRRAILDQQITDERTEMQNLRDMRKKVMTERHEKVCNFRMQNF